MGEKIQLAMLEILAHANALEELADHIPDVLTFMERAKGELRADRAQWLN